MYARHVTVHGSPDKMDEGIRSLQERVLPVLRECAGFKGQLLLVDRDKGEAIGISLWDTEENMRASDPVSGVAPGFAPFNPDPEDLTDAVTNPSRIHLLAPGEPFASRRRKRPTETG